MCYQQGPAEKVQRWIAWVIQAGYKEQLDSTCAEGFLNFWMSGSVWFGITPTAHASLTIATTCHDHQRIIEDARLSKSPSKFFSQELGIMLAEGGCNLSNLVFICGS